MIMRPIPLYERICRVSVDAAAAHVGGVGGVVGCGSSQATEAVPGKQGLSKISYEYQVYPLWLLQEPRNMAPVNIDIVDG